MIPDPYTSLPATKRDTKATRYSENRILTAEMMESRASVILDVVNDYLKGNDDSYQVLIDKLEKSSLKDIGIFTGILTDKMLTFKSQQPGQWSPQEATKADDLLVALMQEIKSRGLKVTAVERTMEVTSQ